MSASLVSPSENNFSFCLRRVVSFCENGGGGFQNFRFSQSARDNSVTFCRLPGRQCSVQFTILLADNSKKKKKKNKTLCFILFLIIQQQEG